MDLVGITLVLFSLITGGLFLYISGDILVENSRRLGLFLKIDPMVIGITIIAFGTSAPELFVSAQGALFGKPDIALGNVVGSCTANILLILGLSACYCAISISRRTLVRDIPIMLGSGVLMLFLSLDLVISRIDGVILCLCLAAFLKYELHNVKVCRKEAQNDSNPEVDCLDSLRKINLIIIGSLVGLMIGSKLLIYGATTIALSFGISELVIGLTIVSIGTSLPEVVTSCVAARKGQSALAVGNVVGSNIFNILGVLGVSSMLHPVPVALAALSFDIPIMILATCVCFKFAFTERTITKGEGAIMLGFYVAYLGYLVLMAKQHAEMPVVSELMLVFVLPLVFYFFYNRKVRGAN